MSFLNKLFGGGLDETIPDVVLGRYSDAFKEEAKYDAWDKSLSLFEQEKYNESYSEFFDYLLDPTQNNLTFKADNGNFTFELLQGSKKIHGNINDQIIKAEAKVAQSGDLSIGLLRRLLELNFSLKYSRFAVDPENTLTLVFDSYLLDGSPYKLYYALKEIAVNADKQDDLLIDEFDKLEPVNTGHTRDLPDEEKEIKFEFLRKKIKSVFDEIDHGKLNNDQYPGGVTYLLLDLVYRLDFLLKPEGPTMEALERTHRVFFAPDGKSPSQKNIAIRKELENIYRVSKEDFFKELYVSSSSFGITSPSNQQQLSSFIQTELPNMDWYLENGHEQIALAVPGYIAGYGFFNYAFPPPVKELLILYYRITEYAFFEKLGFKPLFVDPQTNKPEKNLITAKLKLIEKTYADQYGKFNQVTDNLKFDSLPALTKSYMQMLAGLELEKSQPR